MKEIGNKNNSNELIKGIEEFKTVKTCKEKDFTVSNWLSKEQKEYFNDKFINYEIGRVSSQHRELYKIITESGEVHGSICGSLRYGLKGKSEYPATGDWVVFRALDEERVIIKGILPRKSVLSRKVAGNKMEEQILASNIDKIFITMSLNKDFNIRRIERYINIAWDSCAIPVVILTKSDICEDLQSKLNMLQEVTLGIRIIVVSSLTGDGVDEVRKAINPNESVVFIGSSGVGKSTLINKLMGSSTQLTSEIGDNDKGRHTTTHRELLVLSNGGVIIDTPGMREIQLSTGDIENTFRDIEELAKECYFSDCNHKTEPRCAIKDAIESGTLSVERLRSYEKLKRELFYAEKRRISKEKSKLKKAIGGK